MATIPFVTFLQFSEQRLSHAQFRSVQTSMSVLRMPVSVMKMQIVPTVTVRLVVLVSKDSMEMAQFVKVGFKKHPSRTSQGNHD